MPFLGSKDSVNIDLTKYDTYATTRPCLDTESDVASEFFSTEIHDQSEFINKMYIVCNLTSILAGSFFTGGYAYPEKESYFPKIMLSQDSMSMADAAWELDPRLPERALSTNPQHLF